MCQSIGFCWQIVLLAKEVLLLYPISLNLLVRGNDTQIPNNPKCLHFLLNYFQQRQQHPQPRTADITKRKYDLLPCLGPIVRKKLNEIFSAIFRSLQEKRKPTCWYLQNMNILDLLPRCSSYFKVHSEVFPASSKYPLPISLLSNHNIQSGAPPRLFSDEHFKGITPPTPFSCRVLE